MWRRVLIGEVADVISGGTPSRYDPELWDGAIPWITPTDISKCNGRYLKNTKERITKTGLQRSSAKMLPIGTVLLTSRASVGEAKIAVAECCTNQGFKSLVPKAGYSSEFLYYQICENRLSFQRYAIGSTFPEINKPDVQRVSFDCPETLNEQEEVANILNCIDMQIEQTETLIAKQENIRQGLMQDLFTRGIDETGKLRPPFTEAPHLYHETELGWLPKGWKVTNLKKLTDKITSGSRGWAKYYSIQGAIFVRIGNMTRKHINLSLEEKKYVDPPNSSEGVRTNLQPADLLISITADLGIIGLVPPDLGEAYINQHIALVRLKKLSLSEFIGNFLTTTAGQRQFQRYNDAGAKSGLNLPTVLSLRVPSLDSESESDAITKTINAIDFGVDKLIAELEKLQKQKTGLMHDLLSGDVSVAPLMTRAPA